MTHGHLASTSPKRSFKPLQVLSLARKLLQYKLLVKTPTMANGKYNKINYSACTDTLKLRQANRKARLS
jgi:hypothetical protein